MAKLDQEDIELVPGSGIVKLGASGVQMLEQATVPGPAIAATEGRLWLKSDTPNTLQFTDDAGTDHQVAAGASLGSMTVVSGQPQTTTTTDLDVVLATLTADGQTSIITVYVSMTEPGDTASAFACQLSSGFFRNGGTVAQIAAVELVDAKQQAGGANIGPTFTISGNDIKINCDVFADSQTRDWNYFALVQVN